MEKPLFFLSKPFGGRAAILRRTLHFAIPRVQLGIKSYKIRGISTTVKNFFCSFFPHLLAINHVELFDRKAVFHNFFRRQSPSCPAQLVLFIHTDKRPYAVIYKEPQTNQLVHIPIGDDYQLVTDMAKFVTAYEPELLVTPTEHANDKPDSMIISLGDSAYPQHKQWLAKTALDWGHPKGKRRKQILRDLKLP